MFPQRINKDIVTDLINRMYTSDHCGPVISKITSCNILRISGSRFGVIHPLGNLKKNKVEIKDKSYKYGEIWYYKLLKIARDRARVVPRQFEVLLKNAIIINFLNNNI